MNIQSKKYAQVYVYGMKKAYLIDVVQIKTVFYFMFDGYKVQYVEVREQGRKEGGKEIYLQFYSFFFLFYIL